MWADGYQRGDCDLWVARIGYDDTVLWEKDDYRSQYMAEMGMEKNWKRLKKELGLEGE